jgi:hypothetical protein
MPRCERGGAGSKPAGHPIPGRGVAVAHLPWEQVYAGSSPAAQTLGRDLGSGWSPNRPARFDSSAARNNTLIGERASWWGTGPENQRDLRVRGSIPPLSSTRCPETRCLSVRHTGPLRRRAHALREFDSLRLLRVGQSGVSGGEPPPGVVRTPVDVAKLVRPPAATRCTRGFESRPRLSWSRAQGVPGCTPACQFGGAGSTPAGRSQRTRGRSA